MHAQWNGCLRTSIPTPRWANRRAALPGALFVALSVVLFVVLLLPGTGRAQAGLSPLSTSKLRVPSADPVPEGRVELGLHFQMGWASRAFTDEGKIARTRALDTDGLMGLRVTWGILEQQHLGLELGSILPLVFRWGEDHETGTTYSHAGVGDVPLGLKVRFLRHRDFSVALAVMGSVPTGNRIGLNTPRGQVGAGLPMTGHGRVGGGILASTLVAGGLTMDVAILADGAASLRDEDRQWVGAWGLETSLAFSWIERRGFFRVFTPCLELGHRLDVLTRGDPDARIRHRLSLNAGFAIQLTQRIIMTQAAQVDLAGKNQPMGAGWIMGTTILL